MPPECIYSLHFLKKSKFGPKSNATRMYLQPSFFQKFPGEYAPVPLSLRYLINKYMKILIKKTSKFGPEMPPECIYNLHFFGGHAPILLYRAFSTRRWAAGSRFHTR